MIGSGTALIYKMGQEPMDVLSTACKEVIPNLTDAEAQTLDFVYSLIAVNPNIISF
jgi:hypothetical protein